MDTDRTTDHDKGIRAARNARAWAAGIHDGDAFHRGWDATVQAGMYGADASPYCPADENALYAMKGGA